MEEAFSRLVVILSEKKTGEAQIKVSPLSGPARTLQCPARYSNTVIIIIIIIAVSLWYSIDGLKIDDRFFSTCLFCASLNAVSGVECARVG